jgi:hypothetical protein
MWHWDGSLATVDLGQVQLAVAMAPGDRKVQIKTPDELLLATLWDMPAVSATPLVDVYVRGHDLVCLTAPSESFPYHTQLYWTLRTVDVTPTPLVALSLLVSIRTDLLDTHPEIELVTQAARQTSRTIDVAGGPAFVVPLRDGVTLVDFATPEDCVKQEILTPHHDRLSIERSLFGHFLEKGVIRSGRAFAALYANEVADDDASVVCHELLSTELPLTT